MMPISPPIELASFFSIPDIALVFIVALVVFGPKRLPELGRQVGQMARELRKLTGEFTDVFHETRADIRDAVTITDPPVRPYDPLHALDQDHEEGMFEEGLMARSPRLAAPNDAQEIEDEPAERATGLVVSTVPRLPSEEE